MPLDSAEPVHAPYGPLPEGGTVLPVVRWGTPVMHRRQADVTAYDDDLRSLVADLAATMYAADGVGLGGLPGGRGSPRLRLRLPRLVRTNARSGSCATRRSPCRRGRTAGSSRRRRAACRCPGGYVPLARPDVATVHGTGVDGATVTFSGDGMLARCLQHETDHTLGTVFGDRLSTRWRKRLQKNHDKVADHYPDEWPAVPASVE